MLLPTLLTGLPDVTRALAADRKGQPLEASGGDAISDNGEAGRAAALAGALEDAASVLGFGALQLLSVKGPAGLELLARAGETLVLVETSSQQLGPFEAALGGWARAGAPAARAVPPPLPRPVATPSPPASSAGAQRPRATTPTPPGSTPVVRARPASPWARLRHALARGHLSEAAARQRELLAAGMPSEGLGGEPVAPDALAEAMQRMVAGIGSVLAGDTLGGGRALRELTLPTQGNLSLRWAAQLWSARAALGSGSPGVARQHVKDALEVSRQLDVADRAMSQLVAAELLARAGDPAKALAWLAQARSRFERVADRWGVAQSWLAEARLLADDPAAAEERRLEAAQRSWEADPEWDGPPTFLAGRALLRGDLAAVLSILSGVDSPAADRLRRLVEVVHQGGLSLADACDFLRVHAASPSTQAVRVLERVALAAPRFFPAREALSWMLLKLGRYGEAHQILTALAGQSLAPADRALVMLGLSYIAGAVRSGVAEEPSGPPGGATAPEELPRLSDSALQGRPGSVSKLDAVLSGRLAVFQLPDLMEFLRSARRTGLLVLSSEAGMASMRFCDGFIAWASSPVTPSLRDLLARSGPLPAAAVPAEGEPDAALGARLIGEGHLGAEVVEQALREQIEATVRELLRWKDGEFAFSKEAAPPGAAVQVDAQALMLTLYKEMDEASRGPRAAGASA